MVKKRKLFEKLTAGSKNIRFEDFVILLEAFGFELKRINGSHRIYKHPNMPRPFPVQPRGNGQAKPYQVNQFLRFIEKYNLRMHEDDSKENGA